MAAGLALTGCAVTPPVARPVNVIPAPRSGEVRATLAVGGGFLVRVGDDLLAVSSTSVSTSERYFSDPQSSVPLAFAVNLVLSRDGRRVAWASDDAVRVYSWPALDSVAVFPGVGVCSCLMFSPDGESLAWRSSRGVVVVEIASRRELVRDRLDGGLFSASFAFSADGSHLVVASSTLVIFDLRWSAGRRLEDLDDASRPGSIVAKSLNGFCSSVAMGRDGRVFLGMQDGDVRIVDPILGRDIAIVPALGDSVNVLCLSEDGRELIAANAESLVLVDTVTPRVARVVVAPAGPARIVEHRGESIQVTNEGRRISHKRCAHATYATVDRATGTLTGLRPRGFLARHPLRVGDGMLLGRGERLSLHDPISGDLVRLLDRQLESYSVTVDMSRCAEVRIDWSSVIRDARTGEVLSVLREAGGWSPRIVDVSFSPDARELATVWSDGSIRIYPVPPARSRR
ncbi:MAG: WD40 repeat domain-containing protein [Planctomycetota bacterium]